MISVEDQRLRKSDTEVSQRDRPQANEPQAETGEEWLECTKMPPHRAAGLDQVCHAQHHEKQIPGGAIVHTNGCDPKSQSHTQNWCGDSERKDEPIRRRSLFRVSHRGELLQG